MGQFSWISKNGEQIRSEMHHGQKVWMAYLDEDDNVQTVVEPEYEGYDVIRYPQLYTVEPSPDQIHNWFVECEIDPNQGWISNS